MKQKIITSVKILVSIFLLWFLTHTAKLDFSLLPTLLYSPGMLCCTLLMYLVTVAISTWRWYQLNKAQGIPLSYARTILPTYLGIAFNNLLPGGVGGDFFRFYFLSKNASIKKSAIMLSVLFDRITGLLGIFAAVGITTAFHLNIFQQQNFTHYFVFICIGLCAAAITLYLASYLLPKNLGLSTWLSSRFAGKRWLQPILSLLEAVRVYRNSKFTIIECLSASVVIQIFIAITCMLIAKMMHMPSIPFFDYLIAIAVTQIVNLIPIAPGGFGVGEIAFANVLALLNPGVSAMYATIFLAYRIIGIFVYLPGVAVFLFDKQLLQQQAAFREGNIVNAE